MGISKRAAEFIKNHDYMSVRPLNEDDKRKANTDYKRSASYIVEVDFFAHHEFYWNGKCKDLFEMHRMALSW